MAVLKFQQARETVIERIQAAASPVRSERVPLLESRGRVLAEPIRADRDFPPFPRSTRDGYALRSQDLARLPAQLRCKGQVRAGGEFSGEVGAMECVEIMTGAPLPRGADAVVMVEYTSHQGEQVEVKRAVTAGENVVPRGSESRQGDLLLEPGRRIRYGEIAMIASVGRPAVEVYRQPRVAIIPTGDEVVEVEAKPGPNQIRNSNGYSLHAQVSAEHCIPVPLGIAPDREDRLCEMIAEGLKSDLLLLSGGVSMGKYDLVEKVLAEFGAEFFFDGVLIQPGRPLVFGRAQGKREQFRHPGIGNRESGIGGKPEFRTPNPESRTPTFFFGLPGNPLSTMVTFELFVRPALALLSGEPAAPLRFLRARLAKDFRRKPGLDAFLPALLEGDYHDSHVSVVEWKGSGDIASLNRANCYLAVPNETSEMKAGEWVSILPR